jgi:hypothetical protein
VKIATIAIIAASLQLISCSTHHPGESSPGVGDLLCGSQYRYWLLVEDTARKKSQTFYRFDKAGKWRVYVRNANGKFGKYRGGDVILVETWKSVGRDSVDIGGYQWRIITASDSLIVLDGGLFEAQKLRPVSDTMIPLEYLSDMPPE